MSKKALILIAGMALVLAIILAAGCVSTPEPQQQVADDRLVGGWYIENDAQKNLVVMRADGSGFVSDLPTSGNGSLKNLSDLTWVKNANGTITQTFADRRESVTLAYDPAQDILTYPNGLPLKRLDPFVGLWFAYGDGTTLGLKAKISCAFLYDGTGFLTMVNDDGTLQAMPVNWKKNANGTYAVTYPDGFSENFTLDMETLSLTSDASETHVEKKLANENYYLSIIGPWYDAKNNYLTIFSLDGSGTTFKGEEQKENNVQFTWEMSAPDTYVLHVASGTASGGEDISGQDRIWTYDREHDTFTAQDGTVCVRPDDSILNLEIIRF